MSRQVRTSAKALVLRDGKMLAVRISDGQEVWYILPGGGQSAGELLTDTVVREVAEETGLRVRPTELTFVIEGAHGEAFHRVDLVFLCDFLGQTDDSLRIQDTNQTGYAWLDVDTLNLQPLYPSKLRRQIMNLSLGRPHLVYLGNEEIGDPETTE